MQVHYSLALFGILTIASFAQTQSPSAYRVHRLILTSSDLSSHERRAIVHSLRGGTYDLDELAERIRSKVKDEGYPLATVSGIQIERVFSASKRRSADLVCSIHTGDRYRLEEITFQFLVGEPAFKPTRLRAQFPLQEGALFSVRQIADGVENLRDLYLSAGYGNFVVIPKPIYHDARHTFTLEIEIDQGLPMSFGKLLFEGVEPRAGVAQQLLTLWGDVEGKLYSPQVLKDWLRRSQATWSAKDAERSYVSTIGDSSSALNVVLHFQ